MVLSSLYYLSNVKKKYVCGKCANAQQCKNTAMFFGTEITGTLVASKTDSNTQLIEFRWEIMIILISD